MDDLNTYGKNGEEALLSTVKIFSKDIGTKYGLDKCAKSIFIRGRLTSTSEIKLDESAVSGY